jgi:hypothetical protein
LSVILRANCIGSLVTQALTSGETEIDGFVTNTFPNSFYVRNANDELLFVTNYSLRSPITVNLDPMSGLEHAVKPMDPVRIGRNRIDIGSGISIDISKALHFQTRSSVSSCTSEEVSRIGKALHIASTLLSIIETTQSVMDQNGLTHGGAVAFVVNGVQPLRRSHLQKQFYDAAFKIVGLGSGFTPSGDDMLGGFLMAHNSLAAAVNRAPIRLELSLLKERTSWVSARLLDYMQRLILDEQLQSLIDSASGGNPDALVGALETLFPRGHTSGIDIAVGAILGLSLMRDVALKKEETEIIARRLGLSVLA